MPHGNAIQMKKSPQINLSSFSPDGGAWSGGRPIWHTSAQVVAKIAAVELPLNEWQELVGTLTWVGRMPSSQRSSNRPPLRLEGFICEEVSAEVLAQEQVNSILTAVVQGMNANEASNDVRLAATMALYNALDFAQTNFENNMERDYIMRVVCETTLSQDVRVRQAAFECLVSISATYYDKLSLYMQDIFAITSKAVKENEEPVALQAIEFWSSICDEEIEIQDEYSGDFSGDSEVPYFRFIKQALPALVPMLLETLTKQDEDQDQEEGAWNLAMAGGTCLGLVARTVGDDVPKFRLTLRVFECTLLNLLQTKFATYIYSNRAPGRSRQD